MKMQKTTIEDSPIEAMAESFANVFTGKKLAIRNYKEPRYFIRLRERIRDWWMGKVWGLDNL